VGGFPATGSPDLTDRDTDSHPTILSGQYDDGSDPTQRAYRIVETSSALDTVDLIGLYIQSGYADGNSSLGQNRAAGILNTGLLKMTECRLSQHFALAEASSMINEGSAAKARLMDVITTQNLGSMPEVVNKSGAQIQVDSTFEIRKD